jgi:ABC-type glutathione transport system ATPase component
MLVVDEVRKRYSRDPAAPAVLDGVSFELALGATIAVVGESGAGKSTLGRLIAGFERPTSGTITVDGEPPRLRRGRASVTQAVFQHPAEALNPLLSVGTSIAEPLQRAPRARRRARVAELLEAVGIPTARANDRPSAFSGGQLQRIALARALAGEPKLLLCDEPTSALDVSVQAQIVNLLLATQEQLGFACVLVTHDLAVAKSLADDVLVLRNGAVVEHSSADAFFAAPREPYARELLSASS